MENKILLNYIDRVYSYTLKNTFSREEADELSQEIMYTAVKQLPTLKNEESFEPWLWGVARNVTRVFRRTVGKQRAMYSFDTLETLEWQDEYSFEQTEICEQVRTKISMLSKIYREIIIFHYYDNLTCKEIAKRLNVPEGTVTWRLSEGRKKLKKECFDMTETALKPVKMNISITGGGDYNGKTIPFPSAFIRDALSQNILYHCYREGKNVEELAKLCGVPAFYIEDTMQNLLYREAVVEPYNGRYLTNFLIFDEEVNDYNRKDQVNMEPPTKDFIDILKKFTSAVLDTGIYTAEKSINELYYLFGIMAMESLNKNHNPVPYVNLPKRYDGNYWSYHAHMDGIVKHVRGIGIEKNLNNKEEGKSKLIHTSYHFGGFGYRPMMYSKDIDFCEKIIYKNLECQDNITANKEHAANLIKNGYIRRHDDGTLAVTMPVFTLQQKQLFDEMAEEHFKDVLPRLIEVVQKYVEGYRELFPKHLSDEVQRACHNAFVGSFVDVAALAQDKGLFEKPEAGSICDVLVREKGN